MFSIQLIQHQILKCSFKPSLCLFTFQPHLSTLLPLAQGGGKEERMTRKRLSFSSGRKRKGKRERERDEELKKDISFRATARHCQYFSWLCKKRIQKNVFFYFPSFFRIFLVVCLFLLRLPPEGKIFFLFQREAACFSSGWNATTGFCGDRQGFLERPWNMEWKKNTKMGKIKWSRAMNSVKITHLKNYAKYYKACFLNIDLSPIRILILEARETSLQTWALAPWLCSQIDFGTSNRTFT